MKARPAPLAKLSRPRLHDALPRERLFARLDAARKRPAIWICGPPGCGKTTLAASYLDARGIGGVWYQVDSGDLDLSTFFYHLGEAARRVTPESSPLPLLTPEYLPDLAGFARRWFRQFFARLPASSLLVFDNYQEGSESPLDTLLSSVVAEVPEGFAILVISRTDPPGALSRALAHGEMTVLGWEDLKLTRDETAAVAIARGVSSPETVSAVHAQCEGWAAGLTLMLERVRRTGSAQPTRDLGSMDTLFAYFAGLVFDALPQAAQHDLLLCSFLPSLSRRQAEALTANPDTGRVLDQLYRRHLFTNRRGDADAVYEFHGLFRTFLRALAASTLGPEQQLHASRTAAKLLARAGQVGEALRLYAEIEDWESIEEAVLAAAPALLVQGRGLTLRDWIALVPPDRLERSAWIQYWLGAALIPHDQKRARATLTRAYEKLRELDDFAGQVAAASGVVDTYFFSFSGYSELGEWTRNIALLLDQASRFSSSEQRLQACSSYLLAAFFGDGAHPELPKYADEIKRLIREPLDPNLRLRAGTFLVSYAGAVLNPALVRDDLELLDGLAAGDSVTPLRHAQWQVRYAFVCYELGDFELAEARLAVAASLCSEHGLRSPLSILNQVTAYVLSARGDVEGAARAVERMEQILSTDRPVERSQLTVARLVTLVRRDERKSEWPHISHEIAVAMDATGQTWIKVANRIPAAYALTECGECEAVRQWVVDLRAMMAGTCFARYGRDVLLIEANLALHNGATGRARECMRRALRWTAEAEIPILAAQNHQVFARLLSFACREGIETEAVRALAARYRIPLDPALADARTTPLRVVALGRFELWKDGRPLAFKGRQQQRPLGLLKLLVAQGGRGVPVSAVAEGLWPDSDGDRAANALKVALHRLRKLLDYDAAVTVQHGSLFLDRQYCWTDVQAFEERTGVAERHRMANEVEMFESAATDALALYRGAMLPEEEPLPWLVSARERLALKARQLVLALGMHLEASGRAQQACRLYESGLAIEPLSEPLYQRLMIAQMSLGRHAEAMQAFRRCREVLSIVFGIPPSSESQALFRNAQELSQHPPSRNPPVTHSPSS